MSQSSLFDQPVPSRGRVDFLAGLIGTWAFGDKKLNKRERELARTLAEEMAVRVMQLKEAHGGQE